MSQWEKLLKKIYSSPKEMRFEELKKILISYGYQYKETTGGSSHCTFRKKGCMPITIPRHEPIPRIYVEMVRDVVLGEESEDAL